jgi:hypothetical protein
MARAEASSREAQIYDSQIEPVFRGPLGDLTARDFKTLYNHSDPSSRFDLDPGRPQCMKFSRKSCACGGKIQIRSDGRAVCRNCNIVFNDGGNIEGCLVITDHYSDRRPTEPRVVKTNWVPRKGATGHSHLNKFLKACRA